MAAIDRTQLLADVKLYLPDENVLSDQILTNIIENVITTQIPADDEQYYSEALCKSLRAAAFANKAMYAVDVASIKREEVGEVEIERFESGASNTNVWDRYIECLGEVCLYLPGGGYKLGKAIGIKINPGKTPEIQNCPSPNELIF